MNNAAYGKNMGKLRDRIDVRLPINEKDHLEIGNGHQNQAIRHRKCLTTI